MSKSEVSGASKLAFFPSAQALLPAADQALFKTMLDAYATRRIGALRHTERSVFRDLATINDFVRFSRLAPWYWTEEDFERWCRALGKERQLAMATQRHYQSTIRGFLGYLIGNAKFRNLLHREYGIHLVQICHADNCIPHVVERELKQNRRALTHAEIEQLFHAYDAAIAEAVRFRGKDVRPLQRDKAMFCLTYVAGLRASEVIGLDTSSFTPNIAVPALGDFGVVSVWGKGSRGSGPKRRDVVLTYPPLTPLLQWYLDKVRPAFLLHADANEHALFLSERGQRLALSTFESRFQVGVSLAGLEGRGFTPHCLRHSSVTHESLRFSAEAVRRKHGHVYQSTTQAYMHVPDEFVNEEINRAIGKQLDRSLGGKEDGTDNQS